MKSYIFDGLDKTELERIVGAFKDLSGGEIEDIKYIVGNVIAVQKVDASPEIDLLRNEAIAKFPEKLNFLQNVANVITLFLKVLTNEQARKNEIDLVFEDLESLLDSREYNIIREKSGIILSMIEGDLGEIERRSKIENARRGLYPYLVSFRTSIEIRAVRENSKKMFEKASEYEPNILQYIPIASVSLETDGEDDLVFQMDEKTLDYLMEELLALKKDFSEVGAKTSIINCGL